VLLNVTVTGPKTGGYLAVYPHGERVPTTSNLNFSAGRTVNLVADLAGYYGNPTTGATAGLLPSYPERVLDTRSSGTGPIAAASTLQVSSSQFPFLGGLPQDALGVITNVTVTVTDPTGGGYLTVYPHGTSRPTVSNLNFSAGQTVPNLVVVGFGAGGIDLYNGSSGHTNVVVDFEGYFIPPLS
jgi:hypothetical protein